MTSRLVYESRWPSPSLGLQGLGDLLSEGGKVFRLALKLCGFLGYSLASKKQYISVVKIYSPSVD